MQQKKLCIIYNTAPRYREAIFRAIDKEYDCDWYFGETKNDIKEMDTSVLRHVKYYKTIGNSTRYYWKRGMLRLLFKREYQNFFILAESRSITDWLFFLLAFTFFPKKKFYIWTHGWYGKETKFEKNMKLWLFRHVDGSFVYGNYARNLLIENNIPAERLFIIHNSLHYDQQLYIRQNIKSSTIYTEHFECKWPVIIFIGRLTKVKQLDMLVDAVAKLKKNGENYNLVFIGDGVEGNRLKEKVKGLGIEKQVWFYGACYDENTNAELIYNADLCVAPGNVGLTAMHTMVFGTPVISHNNFIWQMPEFEAIHPGETGDFFEYGNLESLQDAISRWFVNKKDKRNEVRFACYKEIDTQWNPQFQMEQIRRYLKM